MRDEVLAELKEDSGSFSLIVYCHVSGGLVFGRAKWRYNIFRTKLPLALEAIRYGDRILFDSNPKFDLTPIIVNFKSAIERYNKTENWGHIGDYKI